MTTVLWVEFLAITLLGVAAFASTDLARRSGHVSRRVQLVLEVAVLWVLLLAAALFVADYALNSSAGDQAAIRTLTGEAPILAQVILASVIAAYCVAVISISRSRLVTSAAQSATHRIGTWAAIHR